MLETQIINDGKKPYLVILDYKECTRLKEIEEDYKDLKEIERCKIKSQDFIDHKSLMEKLNLNS